MQHCFRTKPLERQSAGRVTRWRRETMSAYPHTTPLTPEAHLNSKSVL